MCSHKYNTRFQSYNKNKDILIERLKHLMNLSVWEYLDENQRINRFDEIFKLLDTNRLLLNNEKFKHVILEKIQYLKDNNVFIGYYWSQKIY